MKFSPLREERAGRGRGWGRGRGPQAREITSSNRVEPHRMEVQIFGLKSCNETKKALRFFKERRIKTHFVDLKERAAAPGELRRFAERLGAESLLDRGGKRFRERGLHVAHVPEARILPLDRKSVV